MDGVIFLSCISLIAIGFILTFIFHFHCGKYYVIYKIEKINFSGINDTFRLNENPNDATLERALRQFIDLLTQEALPINEGQKFIHSLLSLAVS